MTLFPYIDFFVFLHHLQDVKNSRSTDSIRLLALLSLGEVGHHVDLSGQPELKTVILDAFSSSSEEVTPHHFLDINYF